jgi:hypothetical protein
VNWRLIVWAVLGTLGVILLVAYGQAILFNPAAGPNAEENPRFVIPPTPTPSRTPPPVPTSQGRSFSFLEPTATPTPVPGGWALVLTPEAKDVGWVASDDQSIIADTGPQNHFGDSFLYSGTLEGRVYHAAMQFDLGQIPRGSEIQAASLRLVGLRGDHLDEGGGGAWQLQLLASEIDHRWRDHNYQQIHQAPAWSAFEPLLTPGELGGEGQVNLFEFNPEQLTLLERRLLEGSDRFGKKISFRLDGPGQGGDNLFAWDSGYGQFSQGAGPELFLSLGPPPEATPPPYYVVVTHTPTPETVMTALANSLRQTAEATRLGTATPLPPHWVTPVVVTATPTAENQATAQVMQRQATAVALTTGEPPNIATATATPPFVVITSTPTPETVETARAVSWWLTAEAARIGTATPMLPNWVTPVVVTSTPTPENAATVEYLRAVALTTGTPTPLPGNAVTATPTPVLVLLEGEIPTPAPSPTPTATPQHIPPQLVGKIAFLSDRAFHTNERTQRLEGERALPLGEPLVYVMDPDGGNLALLSDRWPYDQAVERDALSSDQRFRVLVKDAVHWEDGNQVMLPALYVLDTLYNAEEQITHFGGGMAYDPSWSPTAEAITFVSNDSGNEEIWVINRDGTGALQLTRNQWEWDKHPSWSPDGSKIVFWSNRTGNRGIWVMDADGGNLHSLSRTEFNDWDPVWIKYSDLPPDLGQ